LRHFNQSLTQDTGVWILANLNRALKKFKITEKIPDSIQNKGSKGQEVRRAKCTTCLLPENLFHFAKEKTAGNFRDIIL
jgi:hypothetical protein